MSTSFSGSISPDSEIGASARRSVSNAARVRCAMITIAIPRTAAAANAPRHPTVSASAGSVAPASAAPTGTPVCFSENVNAIRLGGVVRISSCDDAAVIGP